MGLKFFKEPVEDWSIGRIILLCVLAIFAAIFLMFGVAYAVSSCSPYLTLY